MAKEWVGVDLDGTLAKIDGWNGPYEIGEPIPSMVDMVKKWIEQGHTVKIFTARIADNDPKTKEAIQAWTKQHIGQELEVTNQKDMHMKAIFDDKAIRVKKNTGKLIW